MSNLIFPKKMKRSAKGKVESTTLGPFGGGWNAIDDDLTMQPRYCRMLRNFQRMSSGTQAVRFGSNWHADIKGVRNSPIVDTTYFNGRGIIVTQSGHILTMTDAGTITEIWNATIAAALPGAPATWSGGLTSACFVPFKDKLVIHNGVDKPVEINSTFAVTYLQDPSSGSNVNVPIGRFGCIASNYHCIAGFANRPTEVVISAQGTSGVFPGDPAPNDSISVDVGAYAPEGAAAIRGIAGYRSFLIVFLQGIALQVQLGEYEETSESRIHTPKFPDNFPKFGITGQRGITLIENDLIFTGLAGLSSASRNVYSTSSIESSYISNIVEPEYRRLLGLLTDDEQLKTMFTVYDPLQRNLLIFTKGGTALCYTSNEKLRYKAWSLFDGMDYTCGFTSFLGRVFLCKGTKIFQHGNNVFGERYYAERLNDRDYNWAVAQTQTAGQIAYDTVEEVSYKVLVTHTSPATGTFAQYREAHPTHFERYDGEAINIDLETPWIKGRDPMKTKLLRHVSIATKGTAEFQIAAYVDDLYKDDDDNEIFDPAATIILRGNQAPGFGADDLTGPYGGGRPSSDPRLWKMPAKFKTIKFRLTGAVKHHLEISTLSFLFSRGNFMR